ncbi:LAETG motif-containing sortase-dependent surface protein [Streptomyces purpureus]|uniref:LAETG motif-containing sortase-dependent surface protein n=1 Tax=Streptomyces purpureus TaxID=1951 RepID=UPI00379B2903
MFSVRRPGIARLAAATLATGLVAAAAIALAGPAAAEEITQNSGGASATLGRLAIHDTVTIQETGGRQWQAQAGLFEMAVQPGGAIQTYCIDLRTPARQGTEYKEVGWDQSSLHNNADAGKIRWILQNSFPQVNDLAALARKVGADKLTEGTAAAGTQAAIWHFSDKVKAVPTDGNARKLATYLEKEAKNLKEPGASLKLDPPSVAGAPGGRLGPVTVTTNAAKASVTLAAGAPAGVKVVDKAGKPVTDVTNGAQIFFDVPAGTADGTTSLTVQADTTVPIGRAFVSETKSQTLILAGTSTSTVSAQAGAAWAKKGPIPALSVEKNCAKGGLDITAANKGDEDFTFELKGLKYTIPAGASKSVTIPVAEDQAYDFTITGPNGFRKTFKGVLDCKTASPAPSEPPAPQPSPASAGGTTTGGSTTGTTGGGDLAETGGSSATPLIAGVAVVLVVVGGGAVFMLRQRKSIGS